MDTVGAHQLPAGNYPGHARFIRKGEKYVSMVDEDDWHSGRTCWCALLCEAHVDAAAAAATVQRTTSSAITALDAGAITVQSSVATFPVNVVSH